MLIKFRDAEFYSKKSDAGGGRNVAESIIPFSEKHHIYDLGSGIHPFKISGYVIGTDHKNKAKKLIKALESPGPGELLHPVLGPVSCYCKKWQALENQTGNITSFELSFVKADSLTIQITPVAHPQSVQAISDEIINTIQERLITSLENSGPDFLTEAQNALDNVMAQITPYMDAAKNAINQIARAEAVIRNVRENLRKLINFPNELTNRLRNAINGVMEAILGGDKSALRKDSVENALGMFKHEEHESFPPTHPARQSVEFMEIVAVTNICGVVLKNVDAQGSNIQPGNPETQSGLQNSVSDLEAIHHLIEHAINRASENSHDPELYRALVSLRREASRVFFEAIKNVEVHQTDDITPAIVLAYRLNPDNFLATETDIIKRNSFKHPGFIPALSKIEISRREQ